jgi:hypothetical protein
LLRGRKKEHEIVGARFDTAEWIALDEVIFRGPVSSIFPPA